MLNYCQHVLPVSVRTAVCDPVLNHIHGWIKPLLSKRESERGRREEITVTVLGEGMQRGET